MIGTVVQWQTQKGMGIIRSGEQEYFVNYKSIVGGNRLTVEAEVAFELNETAVKKEGLPEAISVMGPAVIAATQGGQMGTVCEWYVGKAYGFLLGVDGSKVYAHISSFDGAKLSVGKTVNYDTTDVGHKSGRRVAINVSGPAVQPVAGTRGIVKSWVSSKNFGFAEDAAGNEVFIHGSNIGGGWLMTGKEIFFDTEPGKGEQSNKMSAINVTGAAVREHDNQSSTKGMKGGKGGRIAGVSTKGKGKGKSGPEKRKDIDGNFYTKSDFFEQYGGYNEWDSKELRMSPANGNMYNKDMFEKHFGGLSEWEAAKGKNNSFSPYANSKGRGRGGKGKRVKKEVKAEVIDVEMNN